MLRHFVSKTAIPVQINITTTSTVIKNKPIHSSNTNSNNSKNNNGWWTQSYPQGGYKKITKVVKQKRHVSNFIDNLSAVFSKVFLKC